MKIGIGVMFMTIALTAVALWPGAGEILRGLFVPTLPRADTEAVAWTVSLIGGIGGTLTVLAYGYWLREEGRTSPDDLRPAASILRQAIPSSRCSASSWSSSGRA